MIVRVQFCRICALFVCCLAFGLLPSAGIKAANAGLTLAYELFAEGSWWDCSLECRRLTCGHPDFWEAQVLRAVAETRAGLPRRDVLLQLAGNELVPESSALLARFEWARASWAEGHWRDAFEGFRLVFNRTTSTELMIRAGCSLGILMHRHSALARDYPELMPQVRTLRALYTVEIVEECRAPLASGQRSWSGLPGQWMIGFYRSQIRPVLGERCQMVPNCSEYARQAFDKHGALGVAIIGDRFFREPSVVAAAERPMVINGRLCYADPLSDHDFWFGGDLNP